MSAFLATQFALSLHFPERSGQIGKTLKVHEEVQEGLCPPTSIVGL